MPPPAFGTHLEVTPDARRRFARCRKGTGVVVESPATIDGPTPISLARTSRARWVGVVDSSVRASREWWGGMRSRCEGVEGGGEEEQ